MTFTTILCKFEWQDILAQKHSTPFADGLAEIMVDHENNMCDTLIT